MPEKNVPKDYLAKCNNMYKLHNSDKSKVI